MHVIWVKLRTVAAAATAVAAEAMHETLNEVWAWFPYFRHSLVCRVMGLTVSAATPDTNIATRPKPSAPSISCFINKQKLYIHI